MKWPTRLQWVGQHYELVTLAVALLALAASSAFLAFQLDGAEARLRTMDQTIRPRAEQAFQDLDFGAYSNALARLVQPARIGESSNRFFVSEIRVFCVQCGKWIEYAARKCPFCEAEQPPPPGKDVDSDLDGIPDTWEESHGLDPYNPDDARLDHDGDGFSTLEEYRAGTEPRNADSAPSILGKLRLRRVWTTPFKLRFVAVQHLTATEERYQLNARTLERTYFPKIGDEVEGYRVEQYDRATDTLVLRRGDVVRRLQRGRVIDDDQLNLQLVFLLDGTNLQCRVGDTFTIRGLTARVVEVSRDRQSARIVREGTSEEHVVTMPTPQEEAEMRLRLSAPLGTPEGPAAPPAPVGPAPPALMPARPGALQ
ncbi:MAG: hypothetical protein N2652_02635 [Kiritimatiellae bacterium]|nr:hypothetical protein [Kiritimatiellia bacterium]